MKNHTKSAPQEFQRKPLEIQGNAKQLVIAVQRYAGSPKEIVGIPMEFQSE